MLFVLSGTEDEWKTTLMFPASTILQVNAKESKCTYTQYPIS